MSCHASAAKLRLLCIISLLLASCGSTSKQTEATNPSSVQTASIPRLGAGPHLGMITGFDPLTTARYDQPSRVADLNAQAVAAGKNISRLQTDWTELETNPGVYDATLMRELLDSIATDGLPAYVTLSTLDSEGFTLPEYLMDGDSLRDDLTLSSQEVTGAFENFLDWFVPQLTGAGVWGLSIGNEGEGLLEEAIVTSEDFLTFFKSGLARVNSLDPALSSSVTFTGGGFTNFPNETKAILEYSDHATVNFYCLDSGLQVTGESTWASYLAALKNDVGGKPIFFQELGCPAGFGDDGADAPARPPNGIAGSPGFQSQFIEYMVDVFIRDQQFIGATWFQLLDWSPELASNYTAPIAEEGYPTVAAMVEEWLATSGLCRWADGTCRVGWDQWLQGLTAAKREREQRQP